MAGLNYESEKSQKRIRQILAFLLGRPRDGATLKQIQLMLKCSHGTAHRFVNHLLEWNRIHVAVEAKATQQGHTPARFRLGHKIVTPMIPGLKYADIPLNFFGPKTMSTETTDAPHGHHHYQNNIEPAMTEYLNADQYHPGRVGPYQCKMIGAFDDGSGITHMRWWDGLHWSHPLQPDHEDLDGNYCKPEDTYFIHATAFDVQDEAEYLKRFAWCGYAEDPDPL